MCGGGRRATELQRDCNPSHNTRREREGELSSTLPGCCVRVDGKRNIKGASKKEKKTANVVRGLRSS